MNEMAKELCHFGFSKGSERKNHKYFARIEGSRPGTYRYFYSMIDYNKWKNGAKNKINEATTLWKSGAKDIKSTARNKANEAVKTWKTGANELRNEVKSKASEAVKTWKTGAKDITKFKGQNEGFTEYLDKVKGIGYARDKNKETRNKAFEKYANTAGSHGNDIQEYIKALKAIDRKNKNAIKSDEEYYKIAMRSKGLKKKHIKEMNETRKLVNKQITDDYKNEIANIIRSVKEIKMSDLDTGDKSILISAGKSAVKELAKGYVSNMLVNNVAGSGLMLQRLLGQEYH